MDTKFAIGDDGEIDYTKINFVDHQSGGTAEDVSLARDAYRKECYDTFPVSTLQGVKHSAARGFDYAKSCVKGVCSWVSKKGGRTKRKRRRVKRKTKRRKKRKRRKTRKRKRRRRGGVAAGFLGEQSCGEVRQHPMFDDCCGLDKAEIEAEKAEIEAEKVKIEAEKDVIEIVRNQCIERLRAERERREAEQQQEE